MPLQSFGSLISSALIGPQLRYSERPTIGQEPERDSSSGATGVRCASEAGRAPSVAVSRIAMKFGTQASERLGPRDARFLWMIPAMMRRNASKRRR